MNWGNASKQWAYIFSPSGIAFLGFIGCWIAYLFQENGLRGTAIGWSACILCFASVSLYAEGEVTKK